MSKTKHNGLVFWAKTRTTSMASGSLSYRDFWERGTWHNICSASSNFSKRSSFLVLPSLVNIFPVFSSNGNTFVCNWCPVSGLWRLILGLLSILTSTVASIFPEERNQQKPTLSYKRIRERVVHGGLGESSGTVHERIKIDDHGSRI